MLRFVLIDDIQTALTADDLVVGAHLLDTRTYFHTDHSFQERHTALNNIVKESIFTLKHNSDRITPVYPDANM